jgi:uncharacterized protein with HEPN domain
VRDPRQRLRDILEAIQRIQRHARRGRAEFDKDELIQSWVVRHLELIGEAAGALPDDVRALAPGVPWKAVVGLRDLLGHRDFDVDTDLVWRVVERDLPVLEPEVTNVLRTLEGGK